MTKNRTMRASILVLALVLITSCFVGGTFAKYTTTGGASDGARVAKWGVEVFATESGSVYADEYQTSVEGATGVVVKADEKVVAPGTNSAEAGSTLIFGVTGTPEVATKITTKFTGNDIYVGDYHPIEFTLSILDNNAAIDVANADWSGAKVVTGDFATIQAAINNYASFTAEAGETLDALFKIDWTWAYEQYDADDVSMDTNDTLLGDLAAGAVTTDLEYNTALSYSVTVTVTQAD